jgi:hypothetical protein
VVENLLNWKQQMDPRKLFADDRLTGQCVFCGARPETRDHCPSRVFLDEPFPENLPVVDACKSCNGDFSKDEQYLACFIECVICGSTQSDKIRRSKIQRILMEAPKLAAKLQASQTKDGNGNLIWQPDVERVRNVILKLARGHIAYELSSPHIEKPKHLTFASLGTMSDEQRTAFENPSADGLVGYPEIGSRAFKRTVIVEQTAYQDNGWIIVQSGNYRYLVDQSDEEFVQIVVGEYLACRISW